MLTSCARFFDASRVTHTPQHHNPPFPPPKKKANHCVWIPEPKVRHYPTGILLVYPERGPDGGATIPLPATRHAAHPTSAPFSGMVATASNLIDADVDADVDADTDADIDIAVCVVVVMPV